MVSFQVWNSKGGEQKTIKLNLTDVSHVVLTVPSFYVSAFLMWFLLLPPSWLWGEWGTPALGLHTVSSLLLAGYVLSTVLPGLSCLLCRPWGSLLHCFTRLSSQSISGAASDGGQLGQVVLLYVRDLTAPTRLKPEACPSTPAFSSMSPMPSSRRWREGHANP